ncbi:MAG: hypothetical protein IJK93_08305 [Muribaculaceae bacterium]|nr:hypothetical protein [Muribaculaceae bacterium]
MNNPRNSAQANVDGSDPTHGGCVLGSPLATGVHIMQPAVNLPRSRLLTHPDLLPVT